MAWICGKDGLTLEDGKKCPKCKQLGRGGVAGPQHAHENGVSKDSSTCRDCVPQELK